MSKSALRRRACKALADTNATFCEEGAAAGKAKPRFLQKNRGEPFGSPRRGRSDWIRTSGHLNPIQVLYQTEPHPGVAIRCACSLSRKRESLTCFAIAPYSHKTRFAGVLREPCGQIPALIRFCASVKVSPAAGLLLIPTKRTSPAFCGS